MKRAGARPALSLLQGYNYFEFAGVGEVTVLSCLLASVFEDALGVAEVLAPAALELELGVELVLGALEPPAALESLSFDFDLVEPLEASLSFLCFFSPLCLPLFVCVRPLASVDMFGL